MDKLLRPGECFVQKQNSFSKRSFLSSIAKCIKKSRSKFQELFHRLWIPPLQGRDRYNSFTYPQSGFEIKDGKLILSKIGKVKINQHREIEGTIKTCTIKKDV